MEEDDIKINYAWTSDTYKGATYDRLVQIGCMLFWKEPRQLKVLAQHLDSDSTSAQLKWFGDVETLWDIVIRLYGNKTGRSKIVVKKAWIKTAIKTTAEMTEEMMGYSRTILKPTETGCQAIYQRDLPVDEALKSYLAIMGKIPLAGFTHFLSDNKQHITELAAELLQPIVIMPTTSLSSNSNQYQPWKYYLHCNCCSKPMHTAVDFIDMIRLGTRIILHHNFYCDGDESMLETHGIDLNWSGFCLSADEQKDLSEGVPEGFQFHPCQPSNANGIITTSPYYSRRRQIFDACKVDAARSDSDISRLKSNTSALVSLLFPLEVSVDTIGDHPLVAALSNLMDELMNDAINIWTVPGGAGHNLFVQEHGGDGVPSLVENLHTKSTSQESRDKHTKKKAAVGRNLESVMRCRPLQVTLTDIQVDPIASLKPDASWPNDKSQDKDVQNAKSGKQDFASYKGKVPFKVGSLEVDEGKILAFEVVDGRGDEVLHMLSYYYAKHIIRIDKEFSFDKLKKSLTRSKVKLPRELETFMTNYTITSPTLVVVTDCPRKQNTKTSLGKLTTELASKTAWFVPSEFFLMQFPMKVIDELRLGKRKFFDVSEDMRQKFRTPIDLSLKYEVRRIKLYSLYPHKVYKVTLSTGNKIFVDQCMNNIQEPWMVEKLSSLCHVSGPFGVTIGVGKRAVVSKSTSTNQSVTNVWYDYRNKYNACVPGGIVNWLHAVGCCKEASQMMEWATSKSVVKNDEGANVKEAFHFLTSELHIKSVKINFTKTSLSLEETVRLFSEFTFPSILILSYASSHQTHSLVVSNKVVYDLQDSSPYQLTLSGLKRKLSGDSDIIELVGAYYFHVKKKKMSISGCPNKQLDVTFDHVPFYRTLIASFGQNKKKKKKKRKTA
jgi:hypothetical protein